MKSKEKRALLTEVGRVDKNIWIALVFLCAIGLLMVYSASSYGASMSKESNYDSLYYVKRQGMFMLAGFAFIFLFQFFTLHIVKIFSILIYLGGVGSIFLLKTPLAVSSHGATRWVKIAGVQFQIAELVKIAVIVMLAFLIDRYHNSDDKVKLTLYLWAAGGVPALLLFKISSDLSSSIVVLGIMFCTTFICCKTVMMHLGVGALGAAGVLMYVLNIARNLPSQAQLDELPFRVGRIAAFLSPESYASGQGYQVLQSLYAIARGGFFGKGLGNSLQKFIIPEAHTDMIFAIYCEELGVAGMILFVMLLAYLLFLLAKVALSAENMFESVLVLGVSLHVGIQSVINMAVSLNMIPNTGIGLPFMSYGGTSVLCLLLEMALVLSAERHRVIQTALRGCRKRWEGELLLKFSSVPT